MWGRIRRETEAARANMLASEEARRGVTLTLISSVIIGYVTLLDLDGDVAYDLASLVDLFEMRGCEAKRLRAAVPFVRERRFLRRVVRHEGDGMYHFQVTGSAFVTEAIPDTTVRSALYGSCL